MTQKPAVQLAVIGAGLIGVRHAEHILRTPGAALMAVVDPTEAGRVLAERLGSRWYASFAEMLAVARPDGVVIATPNQLHVQNGLEAVAAGIPAIVEKPLADDLAEGARLVAAAEAAGVALLTGHHRRYNPMIQKAKEIISAGRLGRILSLHGHFWLMKPEEYFEPEWRRAPGAGPVLTNLIHDVDLFRYLCGEVVSVQAQGSNVVRGHAVEETAVILLGFESGALGTVNVSDSIVAPWSWEMTSGENPAYAQQSTFCYQIGGTEGAMTVPDLEVWQHPGKRSWWEPLVRERVPFVPDDPLAVQIRHFCAVIRGEEAPLVTGREGLQTLRVIRAVGEAMQSGERVMLA